MPIKNKRGDIPVMILVIGVFAICSLAILSFIGSNKLSAKDSLGIGLIEEINADVEKYYFYKNLEGVSDEEIIKILDIKKDEEGKYFFREKKKEYLDPEWGLNWRKEKFLFSVRYPVPE